MSVISRLWAHEDVLGEAVYRVSREFVKYGFASTYEMLEVPVLYTRRERLLRSGRVIRTYRPIGLPQPKVRERKTQLVLVSADYGIYLAPRWRQLVMEDRTGQVLLASTPVDVIAALLGPYSDRDDLVVRFVEDLEQLVR